eukprot:Rhum_TRINITY_DN12811_c0_g1::Rhum_TRINITY_DN12811_c0_g1_i1::g.54668::m.54668
MLPQRRGRRQGAQRREGHDVAETGLHLPVHQRLLLRVALLQLHLPHQARRVRPEVGALLLRPQCLVKSTLVAVLQRLELAVPLRTLRVRHLVPLPVPQRLPLLRVRRHVHPVLPRPQVHAVPARIQRLLLQVLLLALPVLHLLVHLPVRGAPLPHLAQRTHRVHSGPLRHAPLLRLLLLAVRAPQTPLVRGRPRGCRTLLRQRRVQPRLLRLLRLPLLRRRARRHRTPRVVRARRRDGRAAAEALRGRVALLQVGLPQLRRGGGHDGGRRRVLADRGRAAAAAAAAAAPADELALLGVLGGRRRLLLRVAAGGGGVHVLVVGHRTRPSVCKGSVCGCPMKYRYCSF